MAFISLNELNDGTLKINSSITVFGDGDGKCFRCYYSNSQDDIETIYNQINGYYPAAVFPEGIYFPFYNTDPNGSVGAVDNSNIFDPPAEPIPNYFYIILAKEYTEGVGYAESIIRSSNIVNYLSPPLYKGLLLFDNYDYAQSVITYLTGQTGEPTNTTILEAAGNNYTSTLTGYTGGLNFANKISSYTIDTTFDASTGYFVIGRLSYFSNVSYSSTTTDPNSFSSTTTSPTANVVFTPITDLPIFYTGTDLSPTDGISMYVLVSVKQNNGLSLYLKAGSHVPYLLNYLNSNSVNLITSIQPFLASINQSDYYLTYNNTTIPSSGDNILFDNGYTWTGYSSNLSTYNGTTYTNTLTDLVNNKSPYANGDSIVSSGNLSIFISITSTPFKSFLYFNTAADADSALTFMKNNTTNSFVDVPEFLDLWSSDEVTIGTQTWKTRNLDVTKYTDGTEIPQIISMNQWFATETGAWCYYNFDPTKHKLYNWYAVAGIFDEASKSDISIRKSIAPSGYHVPTFSDLNTFKTYVDANFTDGYQSIMLSKTNTTGWSGVELGGLDNNVFNGLGNNGRWWSSESGRPPIEAVAYALLVDNGIYVMTSGGIGGVLVKNGASIRLIKDNTSSTYQTVASDSSSTTVPDSSSTTTPYTSSTTAPDSSSTTAPDSSSTTAPYTSSTTTPYTSSTTAPDSSSTTAPNSSSTTSPNLPTPKYAYYPNTPSTPQIGDLSSFATVTRWIIYAFVSSLVDESEQRTLDIVIPTRLRTVPSPVDTVITGDNYTLWVYLPASETFNLVFVSGPAAALNLEQELSNNTQYVHTDVFTNFLPRRKNACALLPGSSEIPDSQSTAILTNPNAIYYKWSYSLFDTYQSWNIVEVYQPDNNRILQVWANPDLAPGQTFAAEHDFFSPSDQYGFITLIFQPTIPVICFLKGALIEVDQGIIPIETVDPLLHTLNGKRIVALTKERNPKAKLVTLRRHIISENVPDRDTAITVWHKVFYKDDYRIAGQVPGLRSRPYNGEILYNILMESLEPMKVNNMQTLSLAPDHPVVKKQNYLD